MVYLLYGLGLTGVLLLMVFGSGGASSLLESEFIGWWLLGAGVLLACCSRLPCRLCRLAPRFLHLPCGSLPCAHP